MNELDRLKLERVEIQQKQIKYAKENRLEYYDPYPFQVEFHNDPDPRKALQSANKIGKTWAVCAEDAYDLTGKYPDWWKGYRFDRPVRLVCGGINNDKTRDLLQKALFGDPVIWQESLGSGWIPKNCIGKIQKKRGVSDAFMHVKIKWHKNGKWDGKSYSNITFQSYESGKMAWMGDEIDIFHLDEEPDEEIFDQAGRGCISSGGRIRLSYTPEKGRSKVVMRVEKDYSFHSAGWIDVAGEDFILKDPKTNLPIKIDNEVIEFKTVRTLKGRPGHMTEEATLLAAKSFPPYQLPMRAKGIPVLGSGQVFTYSEETIKITPLEEIPKSWPRGSAIDFGGTSDDAHPSAVVFGAWDETNDVIYIYDGFRTYSEEVVEVASRINGKPNTDWIPMFWPHDGGKGKKKGDPGGGSVADKYRKYGVQMWETNFTNPDDEKSEGKSSISIEPGILEISERIFDRRIRIYNTFPEWFEEYRNYHQKDGVIQPVDDDLMAATRYLVQMRRHFVKESDIENYEFEDEDNGIPQGTTGYG